MSKSSGGHNVGTADETAFRQMAATQLLRQGVSQLGAHQLIAGGPIANPGDRVRLAHILREQLGFATEQPVSAVGMLIPAVQAARTAARRTTTDQQVALGIVRLGVSTFGAQQFLAGLPVTQPDDQKRLAEIITAAAAGTAAGRVRHTGGMNAVLLDGSVR
jgi:prepilin-type processing-associated H-X9-DG protein